MSMLRGSLGGFPDGIMSDPADFRRVLRKGPRADGGYPIYFVMSNGDDCCWQCASNHRGDIAQAINAARKGRWAEREFLPAGWQANLEDDSIYCAECSLRIPSAYEETIEDVDARRLASFWHGGQSSELYKLSSSGAIQDLRAILREIGECVAMLREICECDPESTADAANLAALAFYCEHHFPRAPYPQHGYWQSLRW